MFDEEDDGHKPIEQIALERVFEGKTLNIRDLMRQDGQIAESIDKSRVQTQGVIQTVITAIEDDKNYRQILKRALWKNTEEADKAVMASAACDATGAVKLKRVIYDRITARSAGENGYIISKALEALTHTTFITRSQKEKYERDKHKSNSPLAP